MMAMTDEQLKKFLGIAGYAEADRYIKAMSSEKRDLFDRMATLETELALWQEGLGPKPTGVLIDTERDTKRRRAWR
jgi:hypothetical protein